MFVYACVKNLFELDVQAMHTNTQSGTGSGAGIGKNRESPQQRKGVSGQEKASDSNDSKAKLDLVSKLMPVVYCCLHVPTADMPLTRLVCCFRMRCYFSFLYGHHLKRTRL